MKLKNSVEEGAETAEFMCSKCGQAVPETPRPDYVIGLLAPSAILFLSAYFLHRMELIPETTWSFLSGVLIASSWMLIRTDPHIKQAWRQWR